jgi:hypothetical protein
MVQSVNGRYGKAPYPHGFPGTAYLAEGGDISDFRSLASHRKSRPPRGLSGLLSKEVLDTILKDFSKSEAEVALRDAILSDRAYNRAPADRLELPEGIIEMHPAGLPDAIAQRLETGSGYAAVLFYDSTCDRIVIANRGTEGLLGPDAVADGRQAFGLEAEQYNDAVALAQEVRKFFGADYAITTTGHSLGGGLASLQALVLGTTANTFNAAGVHADTLQRYGIAPGSAAAGIDAYFVDGEILSALQDNPLADLAVGLGFSVPKLAAEFVDELKNPGGHDFNPGLAHVPEALGRRRPLPAVAVQQQDGKVRCSRELGFFQKKWQSASLHGIRRVIGALQYDLEKS